MGFYVDQLSRVMQAQLALFEADQSALEDAEERLEDAAREFDQLKAIESMFGGDTDTSIRSSASQLTRVIEETQASILKVKSSTATGQAGIESAQTAFTTLPSGQPSFFEQALSVGARVLIPGVGAVAGDAFLSWVTGMREARREELAREALMKLTQDMSEVERMIERIKNPDLPQKPSGGDGKDAPKKPQPDTTSGTTEAPKPYDLTQPYTHTPGATPAERVREAIERGMNSVRYDDSAGVSGTSGYPGVIAPKTPLPSTDQWPFDVYHPGDINRDGPLKGGYRVNLDSNIAAMPRDPMLRSNIEEGGRLLGGDLGALGVAGAGVGAGALALGAGRGGATTMSMPGAASGGAMASAPGGAAAGARGGMGMMGGLAGAPGAAGSATSGKGNAGRPGRAGGMGAAAGRSAMTGAGTGARGAMTGAGARGGMMGGIAGGAPGAGAGDKNNAKSQGKGSRFGGAGARGAAGSMGRGAGAGVGAGARGGMIGGIAGGAPGSAAANGKGTSPQGKGRFGGGAAAAGARGGAGAGAASAAASRGAAGARGGMLGGLLGAGGRGNAEEKQQREKTTYGASGVEFFDLGAEQQLDKAGRSGKVSNEVIQVADADDSRW